MIKQKAVHVHGVAMENKSRKCGILLTDLSKAFDCLVHDLLIAKLDAYGFDYLALKLIYSYLTERNQRVRVNAEYSDWKDMKYGVPQGSILGPELYNYNSQIVMATTYGSEKKLHSEHFAPHYTTLSWIYDGVAATATPRP